MLTFIDCPICSGAEKISPEAADELAKAIQGRLDAFEARPHMFPDAPIAELENIRNVILNRAERWPKSRAIDPLLL
jgi:hypothetical protein